MKFQKNYSKKKLNSKQARARSRDKSANSIRSQSDGRSFTHSSGNSPTPKGALRELQKNDQLADLPKEQANAIRSSKCPVCGKKVTRTYSGDVITDINCLANTQPEHLDPIRKLLGIALRDTSMEVCDGLRAEWKGDKFIVTENGQPIAEGSNSDKTLREFRESILSSGKPSGEQIQEVRSALIELSKRPSVARSSGKGAGKTSEDKPTYSDGGYDDGYVWDLCLSEDGELVFDVVYFFRTGAAR
jgi:DNA repair exonuclease SbcCD ATPase subunit